MKREEDEIFRIPDHEPQARLAKLSPVQAEALEKALSRLSESSAAVKRRSRADQEGLPLFLLPLAEFGMAGEQMIRLVERVPADFPFEHRDIYFDFRLDRWIRHIEPSTVAECLEEYFENSGSPEQGLAYLEAQWQAFLQRHRNT